MRQRIDLDHLVLHLIHAARAGKGVGAVDIHRAGAADAFPAGAAEGQRRIDLVLDLDQRVENHRTAVVQIDEERVDAGISAVIRVPAVDLEFPDVRCALGFLPDLAFGHLGIPGKRQLNHFFFAPLFCRPACFREAARSAVNPRG